MPEQQFGAGVSRQKLWIPFLKVVSQSRIADNACLHNTPTPARVLASRDCSETNGGGKQAHFPANDCETDSTSVHLRPHCSLQNGLSNLANIPWLALLQQQDQRQRWAGPIQGGSGQVPRNHLFPQTTLTTPLPEHSLPP